MDVERKPDAIAIFAFLQGIRLRGGAERMVKAMRTGCRVLHCEARATGRWHGIPAVLQFLWSLWIEQCGVYFHPTDKDPSVGAPDLHPTDKDPSVGAPDRKTPLDRIGSAAHQLENRYSLSLTVYHQNCRDKLSRACPVCGSLSV
jgi:hypothetical protein